MKKPLPYKISFITVNYNGLRDTNELLYSIYSADLSFPFEVIVIDNGSGNDEFVKLKKCYPAIKGFYSAQNLGFAGGNNLGIEFAQGEYLYFLNNDTMLPAEADRQLLAMIAFSEQNTEVGGLTPKIKYSEPQDLLQFAGCTPLTAITLRNKQIGYRETDNGQYNQIREIPYMHGAAMFVPRHVVNEVGLMPDLFFLYYEELDWSCQIREIYKLYYFPKAYIFHKESASTGLDSPLKTYYLTRNRILFADRNRKGFTHFIALLYLLFVANLSKLVIFIAKGRWKQARSSYKGIRDALRHLHSSKSQL